MIDIVIQLLTAVINVLPVSPISTFIEKAGTIDGLAMLNWFIPFDIMFNMLGVWSGCMFTYYLYRFTRSNLKN